MITNISLVTVYCLDQDEARDFYVDVLGFRPHTDATLGNGFRWVTVIHPEQPELEVTLMTPGPPLEPDAADFVRRQLQKGSMGGLGLQVDGFWAAFWGGVVVSFVSTVLSIVLPTSDRREG